MTTFNLSKYRPVEKSFNNLVDDLFVQLPSLFKEDFSNSYFKTSVPVNIKDKEKGYELEIVAPGFEKEDFKINLDNNLLTISVEKKEESEEKKEKFVRSEYRFNSFKRSFTLDKNIDIENIDAKYVNGVLKLNLPKKAEVKTTKQISIQ